MFYKKSSARLCYNARFIFTSFNWRMIINRHCQNIRYNSKFFSSIFWQNFPIINISYKQCFCLGRSLCHKCMLFIIADWLLVCFHIIFSFFCITTQITFKSLNLRVIKHIWLPWPISSPHSILIIANTSNGVSQSGFFVFSFSEML